MTETATLVLPATGETPEASTGSIFFIGNATVLIRWAGLTILTDPTFISMSRPGSASGSTRRG